MDVRKIIANRLKSLSEIDGVHVEESKKKGTIRITHDKHHGPEYIFKWGDDHFVGYFIGSDDVWSQAIVSIYTGMEAIQFVAAYSLLNSIRSNQR